MLRSRALLLRSRRRTILILPLWIIAIGWFWIWWIFQVKKSFLPLYVPLSLALFYETVILPSSLLFFTFIAKVPRNRRAPKNKKIAVISLCVPSSESLKVIEKQFQAMSQIAYPHDNWILDEGNSKAVKLLARKYKIKYFSRKGISKYNQKTFPYEAKSKAGNVNAWIDRVKRRKYEYFVQLDIDHNPDPKYLDKALGHFRDPRVAWVQSPSVYKNLNNWIARGSAEQEMGMHGPLQMGFYAFTGLPLIVGSHAAYRMSAIREIGGFQPTRAEDHLNTLVLANNNWKGVFLSDVLAQGEGPETLNAYLTQQYAWARSIIMVIKNYSFKYLKQLNFRQTIQFMFLESWYPLAALNFIILYFTPILGQALNIKIINISVVQFLYHLIPFVIGIAIVLWSAKPLMQPRGLKLSWRGILLHLIRWPSIISGIISAITNKKKPYLVTPKGKFKLIIPTITLYKTFLVLASLSILAIMVPFIIYSNRISENQVLFLIYDAMVMIGVCVIDLNLRLKKIKLKLQTFLRLWFKPISAVLLVIIFLSVALFEVSAVSIQNIFALDNATSSINSYEYLNKVPIQFLNNSQLDEQIASPQYALSRTAPIPDIGLYSPTIAFHNKKPYINSIFMDWRQNWMLAQGLVQSNRTGATSLVTIEPKGDPNGAQLLQNIANGVYDRRLLRILNTIKLDPNTVYVRFAQEMDLPNSFNWGNQNPTLYISAYRKVVNLARTHGITNIKWVWSPAGLPSASLYYPGNNYVNIIGTTMLYDPFWSGNYHPTFSQIQAVRAWLFSYNKPVWITEFGVGDENVNFQTSLIKSALSQYRSDGYQAIIYLNIKDPNVHGPNYTLNNLDVLGDNFVQNYIPGAHNKLKIHKTNQYIIRNKVMKIRSNQLRSKLLLKLGFIGHYKILSNRVKRKSVRMQTNHKGLYPKAISPNLSPLFNSRFLYPNPLIMEYKRKTSISMFIPSTTSSAINKPFPKFLTQLMHYSENEQIMKQIQKKNSKVISRNAIFQQTTNNKSVVWLIHAKR